MRVVPAAVVSLLIACSASAEPRVLPQVRDGDVVLQTSRSGQSQAIQLATDSPWSHVGLIEVTPEGIFVIEAIGKVSRTPWATWKKRGVGEKVTILRPKGLAPVQVAKVLAEARRFLGKPYDAKFGWSDARIYCSELVYKAYQRGAGVKAGAMQKVRELDLNGIEQQVMERYGQIPWDLELVTPASVAEAEIFEELYSDF
ncbi:MAG: YiiX/YebB-like N1pC/P60 family cysteine hydrolase [Myxococcaceae bacterium]